MNELSLALASASRPSRRERRPLHALFLAGALGFLAACATTGSTGSAQPRGGEGSPATASASSSTGESGGTVVETVDNHNGARVFADNKGTAAPPNLSSNAVIPYGTRVKVNCYEPNLSGMGSITNFYRIADGTWQGTFIPSDVMDNGAGMGPNPVNVDPRVLALGQC